VRRIGSGELGVVLDTVFRNGVFPVQYTNGHSELVGRDDVRVITGMASRSSAA
jgi:hypothetical protein